MKKECPLCKHAMISIQFPKRRPQEVCINPKCPSKKIDEEKAKKEEKPCPKCKEGTLIVRRSVYGSFLGCSKYPKCRYTEKLSEVAEKDIVQAAVGEEEVSERDIE